MRSVVVYLRDAMPEEVRQLLQRTCTAQAGSPWVWECDGVLRAYPGVAQDDYTSHSWTLDEVLTGQTVEQHPFFDYRGWHGS